MTRLYFTLISCFAFVAMAMAQETAPTPLSLQDCMDYALKHNYSIKNAAIDVLIQKAQNAQSVSAAYPHINGKMEFDDFNVPQRSFVDASAFSPGIPSGTIIPIAFTLPYAGSAGITASQVIFDGSVSVALKARNTVLEFSKLNGAVTEENVRYNVFKAYNSLVIAYRQYNIIKNSLQFARSIENDVTITQQNGFAEKMDAERANVSVNNLVSDSIRINNILTVSEQVLKYQIGMSINAPIVLTDTVVESRKQIAADLLIAEGTYENVPEYKVVKTALSLNEFNLKRYNLAALPTLSAFWAYGSNYGGLNGRDIFMFNKYWASSTLGVQLTVPIFNGFMRKNQVTEAKLNIEKSKNNIDNMKLTIDFQAAQSRISLKNAILQVQSQHRNLDLSNDVLDLAQRKYKSGVGSNLEVTQAQTDQLRAQTNYFSALLDLINAEADLKKALGLLK